MEKIFVILRIFLIKHEDFFVFLWKKSGFGFPYFSFWKTVFGNAWYKWDYIAFRLIQIQIQFCLKKSCMERKTQKSDFGAIQKQITQAGEVRETPDVLDLSSEMTAS